MLDKLTSNESPALARRGLFYGWVMLPVATIGMMCSSPGQSFSVAVFKPDFETALGLSTSTISGAYMVGTFLAALPMTYIGMCMDKFGARRTLAVIITLMGLACVVISQAQGLVTLFIGFFMLRLFGQGSLTLLNSNTMALWFDRRLGLVSGIMAVGMAGAIALVPKLNVALIDHLGWRSAFVALGLGVWAIMFPLLVVVFRNKPEDVGQRPDGDPEPHADEADQPLTGFTLNQAMRSRAYWIAGSMKGFWALANTALVFCMVSVFQARGMEEATAKHLTANTLTVFGITLALTHLPAGHLADKLPLNRILAFSALCMGATFVIFTNMNDPLWHYPLGVCQGLSQSLLLAVGATLWRRYYGRAHLGRIKGSMTTVMVGASAIGPFLVDGAHDLTGSYQSILLALSLMPLPLAIASLLATPPKRAPTSAA